MYQSTTATSCETPRLAVTLVEVFSMTMPLFAGTRPRICGGVRSVVVKV
jgi:hypothetical protein